MATNKLQWRRIAKGDKLPCQSFLRKKDGEILKLSTVAGVTVGQDAYYLPVDEVINVIKDYPVEESEDERIRKEIIDFVKSRGGFKGDWIAWLEKQGESTDIPTDAVLDSNKDGLIADTIRYKREKQCEQKHQYNSRPRYVGEEELLGTNKQGKCPFLKQELIDMGFAFTQDGDLAYPIHKIDKKEFAAWSKEDERLFQIIIDILDKEEHKGHLSHTDLIACVRKLKSFKPQTTWKPSKEQIEALWNVYQEGKEQVELATLYNDLKKLREE